MKPAWQTDASPDGAGRYVVRVLADGGFGQTVYVGTVHYRNANDAWAAARQLARLLGGDPHVMAAREAARREAYNAKYLEARKNGFSDADARLHAEQALALHDKENER